MKKHLLSIALVTFLMSSSTYAQNTLFSVKIIKTGEEAGVDVSYDDGEFENDAMDKLYDDDLDMGWEGEDLNIMTTFMRFQNVTIPKNATIDSAFINIYAHEDEADPANINIYAEDADNSAVFTESELLADRTWTSAMIEWNITDNWTMWQPYRTIDIKSVIQEVINRSGWNSGNALTIFLKGEDQGASILDNARDFESFENIEDPADGGDGLNHPERIPELKIYYTIGNSVNSEGKSNFNIATLNNGVYNIDFNNSEKASVVVYDLLGNVVKSYESVSNSLKIDLNNYNSGLYFLTVTQNNNKFSYKIIK